ncbi:uncharacterized protein UTRI_10481 [Ustilago trichophora]|uniref:Uncharacterized protein n=1 Tax=Ustilago trichophora TaxID=86804 RepID=A0A5C3E9L8_9BASI|nr:uncharacterized protein UTRI_10481 [Ustilago trichophora]
MKLSVFNPFLFAAFIGATLVASAPLGPELAEKAVKGAARAVEAHPGSASRVASSSEQLANQQKGTPAKAGIAPPQPKVKYVKWDSPPRQSPPQDGFVQLKEWNSPPRKSMRISSIVIYLAAIVGASKVASAPLATPGLLEGAAKGEDAFRAGLDRLPHINTQRYGATVDDYDIERYNLLRSLRKMDQDLHTPVRKGLRRIKTVREPGAIHDEVPRRMRLSEISSSIFMKPISRSNSRIDSSLYSAESSLRSSAASSPMYTARNSPVHPTEDSVMYSAHSSPRYMSDGDIH